MREVTATAAKNRFGQLLDAAQRGPVRVTKNGRAVTVMLSVGEFERLRGSAWVQLVGTMDSLGEHAAVNGLTEAKLGALLVDEI